MNDLTRKYQAEESLIAKAKAEYTKRNMPKESRTESGGGESSWTRSLEFIRSLPWIAIYGGLT